MVILRLILMMLIYDICLQNIFFYSQIGRVHKTGLRKFIKTLPKYLRNKTEYQQKRKKFRFINSSLNHIEES